MNNASTGRTKILLTGAAGHLGSAIRREAAKYEKPAIELVNVDVTSRGEADIHEGSFTDAELVDRLIEGCDAVIHTAALHGGNRKTHTPTQFTEVNVGGFVTLMEACRKHGVKRFVFSSTMEVVIGIDWASSGLAVLDEFSTPAPDWIYPANKLACEQMGQYYFRKHGIEFVALRYMAFGAEVEKLEPHFLARYLLTDDVARANLLAATVGGVGCELMHIGPRNALTNQDIVRSITDPYGVIERHYPGAAQLLKDKDVKIDHNHFWPATRIDRARRQLGWEPQVNFEQYLESLGWTK